MMFPVFFFSTEYPPPKKNADHPFWGGERERGRITAKKLHYTYTFHLVLPQIFVQISKRNGHSTKLIQVDTSPDTKQPYRY